MSVQYFKVDHKDNIISLNNSDISFNDILKKYSTVVVDVYADWCIPCKKMFPKFLKLSQTIGNANIAFCKDNINDKQTIHGNKQYVYNNKVTAVPAYFIYKNGKLYHYMIGGNMESLQKHITS